MLTKQRCALLGNYRDIKKVIGFVQNNLVQNTAVHKINLHVHTHCIEHVLAYELFC